MALLAYAHKDLYDVAYSGGILCYIHHDSVRILDVHGASGTEDVIDMKALVAEISGHHPGSGINIGYLQSYQNGILRLSLDLGSEYNRLTDVVIDVRKSFVPTLSRIRMINRDTVAPQVITDGRYLVRAFNGYRIDGYDDILACEALRWTLECYDLSNPEGAASIIALGEFLKEYPCLFRLLGGWLYAICCEEPFSRHEPDGAKRLYWRCCRFPINDFHPAGPLKPGDLLTHSPYTPLPARLEAVRLFRGLAKDLRGQDCDDLVQDERTGEIFIVESGGGQTIERNSRSRHRYRCIIFPDPPAHTVNSPVTRISEIIQTIDEYPRSSVEAVHQFPADPIQKHERRIYVRPSQSFVDVIYDHGMAEPLQQTMHLCAGSRVPGSPIDPATNFLYEEGAVTEPNIYFIDRGMRRFPPHGAPQEICEVLSAFRDIDTARATDSYADERSLIIVTPQAGDSNQRDYRVILVNFDSGIHFPGFKPLTLESFSDKISYEAHKRETNGGAGHGKINFAELKQRDDSRKLKQNELDNNQLEEANESSITTRRAQTPRSHPWFYTEPAMHLEIGKGFQFHRYPPKSTAG